MMTRSFIAAALTVLAVTSCTNTVRPSAEASMEDAIALRNEGCYDCLLDARELLHRIVRRNEPSTRIARLETALLLAVRRKELALDPTEFLAEARTSASMLSTQLEAATLVEAIAQLPSDDSGTPREEAAGTRLLSAAAKGQALRQGLELLERLSGDPVAATYLRSALHCGYRGAAGETSPAPGRTGEAADVPLLLYRQSICGSTIDPNALSEVRAVVPRFAEAALFEARGLAASGALGDGRQVRELLLLAAAKFRDSSAISYELARSSRAVEDCPDAVEWFTRTLTLRPRHEGAKLGRVICLTELGDAELAMSEATDLIERPTPVNQGEALYWRAWNLRQQHRLTEARSDTDRAKKLLYNSRLLTLAGMTEYDQGDDAAAASDLDEAKALDERNCGARWYLALVRQRSAAAAASAAEFAAAADCNDAVGVAFADARSSMIGQEELSAEFRSRQVSAFEAAIAESRSAASAAALNAAIAYARDGNRDAALRMMDRAEKDPGRRADVNKARRTLPTVGGKRQP